jgi:hypothetical protein
MSLRQTVTEYTDELLKSNPTLPRKSTGPRTEEGKRRSSRNAVKHGIFADHILLPGEDEEQFRQHKVGMLRSLDPRSPLEEQMVEQVVWMLWRLKRVRQAEQEMYGRAMKDGQSVGATLLDLMEAEKGTLERLHQYERRIESSMHRCLNQLRTARKENICGLLDSWTGELLKQCKPESEEQDEAERDMGIQPVPETSESKSCAQSESSARAESPCHSGGHDEVRKTNPNWLEAEDQPEVTVGAQRAEGLGNGHAEPEYRLLPAGSPRLNGVDVVQSG